MIAGIFYAPFLFELFLVGITAFRAWKDYRRHRDGPGTPLFYVLYRGEHSYAFLLVTLIDFHRWCDFLLRHCRISPLEHLDREWSSCFSKFLS